MERLEALTAYYSRGKEDGRLLTRYGSVEFITTVHYIEKYLRPGMKILEIGAGTGRYSHYFARNGYEVDAVELMECNIEVFKAHTLPSEKITVAQGDALDLEIENEQYDITLLLGPMYHLFTVEDQKKALSEAIRVTKKGGIIFAAYCNSDMTMYQYCMGKDMLKPTRAEKKINEETFKLYSLPEDVFQLYRKEDVDLLMEGFNVTRLHYVGTDMLVNFLRREFSELDDEDFEFYVRYHLNICERPDMIGATNHMLDIFRKE